MPAISNATSGQGFGFALVSSFSGTPLTGQSGLISGYRTVGSGLQYGISGYIVEVGRGQYWVNLYDFDTSGSIISYYFLGSSGAVPVEKSFITTLNVSGDIFIASGTNVTVPISSVSGANAVVPISILSGVTPISGATVTVPISSISGAVANSGLFVNVPLATLSGVQPISGTFVSVPISSISGAVANSGLFVSVPIATVSGITVTLVSGSVYVASGSVTSSVSSGNVYLASGFPGYWSGNIYTASGITVNLISGSVYVASGSVTVAAPASGTIYLASGYPSIWSGLVYPASGVNTVVPISTQSGTVAASGLFVSVPIATISGANSIVPIATISGTNAIVPISTLSGLTPVSGATVTIQPASISGTTVSTVSGMTYLASGSVFVDLLRGNMSGLINEAVHSPLNAFRKLTNKWDLTSSSGFLTVYKEDGSTTAYTQVVTVQSGTNPVVSLGDA